MMGMPTVAGASGNRHQIVTLVTAPPAAWVCLKRLNGT